MTRMYHRSAIPLAGLLLGGVVLALVALGMAALLRNDSLGEHGSGLSERFNYDLEPYEKTDPALDRLSTRPAGSPLELEDPRAVAAGPEDRIYVAGDQAIAGLRARTARSVRDIALDDEPRAPGRRRPGARFPGRIYVGVEPTASRSTIPSGSREAVWDSPGPKAVLTSIAAGRAATSTWPTPATGSCCATIRPASSLGRIGARTTRRATSRAS